MEEHEFVARIVRYAAGTNTMCGCAAGEIARPGVCSPDVIPTVKASFRLREL